MISACWRCVREKEREGDGEIVEERERERERDKGMAPTASVCPTTMLYLRTSQCVQNNSMVCICTQNLVNMYMYVVLYMFIVLHSHTVLIILCFRALIPLFGRGSSCEILIIYST